ncbi:MAG: D-alanyl-D-alanine carboxypeptidase [Agathobacter sp.]|nr:D-alanyl-D-alanine carboxypeptidase [Agathobacter sp.]
MKSRNDRRKRVSCAVLAFLMLFLSPIDVKADMYWPQGPSIYTPSAIVIEINSGAVLYEKNSNEQNYPASITKIMTTLLALEHSSMDELVTFSDDAIRYNQGDTSHIARDYDEVMTMEQCLYAVMLESANECAYAVAEHVGQKLGGDYRTFIDLMNQKAKELGCTNTHFNNANGLPDKEHWTSAHDMGLISAAAYKNAIFREIVGTRSYRIPPTNKHDEITPLNNHHAMISNHRTRKYLYEYCTGGKTGYTVAAGSTLVTYAEKDDLALVCVVMRTDGTSQYTDTTNLLENCFKNFHAVNIGENGYAGGETKEENGFMNTYPSFVKLDENAHVVLPNTADISDVELSVVKDKVSDKAIARLKYTYDGHVAGLVDVVLSGASVEDNFFKEKEPSTEKNIILIRKEVIFIGLGILVVLLILIVAGKKLYDNYYVIMHDMKVRKKRRDRFRPVSKRRRRRKRRDRMFK